MWQVIYSFHIYFIYSMMYTHSVYTSLPVACTLLSGDLPVVFTSLLPTTFDELRHAHTQSQ